MLFWLNITFPAKRNEACVYTERKNLQTHRITLVHLKKKTRKNIYKNSISETKTERKIE